MQMGWGNGLKHKKQSSEQNKKQKSEHVCQGSGDNAERTHPPTQAHPSPIVAFRIAVIFLPPTNYWKTVPDPGSLRPE